MKKLILTMGILLSLLSGSEINANVHVSETGGAEGNDGTIEYPYKSIKTAIKECPIGGYRRIFIHGDYTWTSTGDGWMAIYDKHISFVPHSTTPDATVTFVMDNESANMIKITGMTTMEVRINVEIVNTYDIEQTKTIFVIKNGVLVFDDNFTQPGTQIVCTIKNGTRLFFAQSSKIIMDYVSFMLSGNAMIGKYSTGSFSIPPIEYDRFKINSVTLEDYTELSNLIEGKKYTDSGFLYNITSSIDLTQ